MIEIQLLKEQRVAFRVDSSILASSLSRMSRDITFESGGRINFVYWLRSISLLSLAMTVLLAVQGCGQFFPSSTAITAIQVLPSNAIVAPGVTQQYTATATFGNNSTGDVTGKVTWSTNATNIASISSGGLLTGVAFGSTTVKAQTGSVIGNTGVTIQNKAISSVSIQPLTQGLSASGNGGPTTVQYTATATYSDGTTGDVTSNSTWNALPSSVVSISSTGLATAVAVGTATVTATAQGVTSNSATITVIQ